MGSFSSKLIRRNDKYTYDITPSSSMGVNFKTRTYNVALLPQCILNASAKALNGRLSKYGLEFMFSDRVAPHISLYMLQISSHRLGEVLINLSDIAERYNVIDLSLSGWRTRNRYFAAMYTRTKAITDLQQDVVDRLNPLRAETHPDSFIGIKNASALERRNVEWYGWRSIGDVYEPHMTIARFLEEDLSVSLSDFCENEFDGIFDRIALFEMGDSGTTIGQIATFILKNSK